MLYAVRKMDDMKVYLTLSNTSYHTVGLGDEPQPHSFMTEYEQARRRRDHLHSLSQVMSSYTPER